MFGNKKETGKNTTKSNNAGPVSGSHSLNSLVQGTVIEGTVRSENDIRVEGTIKGKLYCEAKVIIGPTGYVEGEINCQNAVIEGKFSGTIHVKDLLNVRENASLNGDVATNKLIIQAGATFNVSCNMSGKTTNKKVSTKPTSANATNAVDKETSNSANASKAS